MSTKMPFWNPSCEPAANWRHERAHPDMYLETTGHRLTPALWFSNHRYCSLSPFFIHSLLLRPGGLAIELSARPAHNRFLLTSFLIFARKDFLFVPGLLCHCSVPLGILYYGGRRMVNIFSREGECCNCLGLA